MSFRIGLVLSGGAAKGAYQIGVWRALEEFGIARQISVVAGTSIGALNTALFMQGDLSLAETLWTTLSTEQVFTVNRDHLEAAAALPVVFQYAIRRLFKKGIFSRQGLEELMDRHLNAEEVTGSAVQGYAACLPVTPSPEAEYLPLNGISPDRLRRILLASSAIPVIFGSERIEGEDYTDGGLGFGSDNLPVQPVYRQGCDLIFVVTLDHDQWVEEADFPAAQVVHIVPSEPLGDLVAATDFSPATARRRINLGYRDACALLSPVKATVELQAARSARLDEFLQGHNATAAHAARERARREALKAEIRRPLSDR